MYALYMMMLFRPWRRPSAALRTWLGDLQAESAHERPSADQVWTKLFEEFLQWRQHIKEVAAPYFRRYWPQDARSLDRPPYDSPEWWACMVYLRLSNLELTLSRKKSVKGSMPSDIDGVPLEEHLHSDEENAGSKQPEGEDSDRDSGDGELGAGSAPADDDSRKYPKVPEILCSPSPSGCCDQAGLLSFFGDPPNLKKKGAHAAYAREYFRFAPKERTLTWDTTSAEPQPSSASSECAHGIALEQDALFKKVDALKEDSNSAHIQVRTEAPEKRQVNAQQVHSLLIHFQGRAPSHTMVLEAAMHLIQVGFCDIADVNQINVKWALALLQFAVWVQLKKSHKWMKEKALESSPLVSLETCTELREFLGEEASEEGVGVLVMILTGAGGSGKTTLVHKLEAFADFFLGDYSMRKSAPTNTAARVCGGDTSHALYKLPFGNTLQSRRSRLTSQVLNAYQEMWRGAHSHAHDEVSMRPPSVFFQIQVRTRVATGQTHALFGGLGTLLTGDFLQLPHPTLPSLATPIDELTGAYKQGADDSDADDTKAPDDKESKEAFVEHRQGHYLWRSIRVVTMLTKNLRAAGPLAKILAEIRELRVSDESWRALQERVLGVERLPDGSLTQTCAPQEDPRLRRPPFSNHYVQYVVQRHVLRVSQSFHNVVHEAARLRRPVYVVLACDSVRSSEDALFTDTVRTAVLQIAKPRKTKYLPGISTWHIGMKLLLFGKNVSAWG